MRFILGFLTVLCFGLNTVYSQDTLRLKLVSSVDVVKGSTYLSSDFYGFHYTLLDNTLYKINKYKSSHFTNSKLGVITSVDLTVSSSPIVFYKESQRVAVLNLLFAQTGIIDFNVKFPNMDIAYIGMAGGRRMWMVDNTGGHVRLYNMSSYERYTIYTFDDMAHRGYVSTLTALYWLTNDNVIKGIDLAGNEIVNYSIGEDIRHWQVLEGHKLLYLSCNQLYYVDLLSKEMYILQLSEKSPISFFYDTQKISIFTGEKLNNYYIKLP
ncbi:hypothetical protein [Myroides pelagicus]|uniref:Glutamine cyclotransferase n=1 Tax=Myroides pelagicus TaxID=270914 RepID=A0A7K1GMS6_9FLAO|nr:hypothetical protein [Myroides pelagicus]MEC4114407.1 hypothetical protein [Myroides pelagicus]MTH30131.1 hypothetical protein [Myroides pelagicus]